MLVTPNVESAALWIPPGGSELTHDEEETFEASLAAVARSEVAAGVVAILELLDAAHPKEPHFYLSLLGTHADHRGKGLGMGLLAESLRRVDALGAPAYLESCNPADNKRYQSVGFVPLDEVTTPTGHVVTTMWRPAS